MQLWTTICKLLSAVHFSFCWYTYGQCPCTEGVLWQGCLCGSFSFLEKFLMGGRLLARWNSRDILKLSISDCWIGGLKLKTPSFWILIKSLEKVGVNHYVITIPLLPRDFTNCWSLLLNLNECSFKSWTSRGGGIDEKGLGTAVCLGKWEGFGFEVFQIHVGVTILY